MSTFIQRLQEVVRLLATPQAVVDSAPQVVADSLPGGWTNEYTGQGTVNDRSMWTLPCTVVPLDIATLTALWLQDPIAGLVIDAIVDDGMRGGFQVVYAGEADSDRELVPVVRRLTRDLGLEDAARLASKASRAFGGAAILPLVNAGEILAEDPLVPNQIRSVDKLIVVDRRDLVPSEWDGHRPRVYTYTPPRFSPELDQGVRLHESHLVLFPGIDTPARDSQAYFDGWCSPALQRVATKIRDFQQNWASAVAMMQNGSMGVLKVPRLWDVMASKGRSVFMNMLAQMQLTQWVARIMPISSDEDFQFVERTFSGVADLLRENQPLVAMAADMPVTRLFGTSPAGLNATGVHDERNWLAKIASWRRGHITRPIEQVVRLVARAAGARDPDMWQITWPQLELITTAEQATIEKTTVEADAIRIAGGMPAGAVLLHRYGSGEYEGTPPMLNESTRAALEETLALELEGLRAGELEVELEGDEPDPAGVEPDPEEVDPVKADPEAVDPQTALNGAQVLALLSVVASVVEGQLPRESGIEIIVSAFPVDRAAAERIMGEVGRGFVAVESETLEPAKPAA